MKGSRSSLIFLLAATLLGRCEGRRTADKWAHQDSTLLPTANHSLPELHPVSLYQKPPTLRSAAEFLGYPSIAGLSPEFAMVALITTSAAVRVGLPRMLESFRFYLAKKNVATRREICDVYANFQRLCVPPSTATGDANSRQILEGIATLPEKDTAGRRAIEEAELTSGCRCAESPFGSKDSGLFDFYNLFAETPLTLEQASEACRREHGEKGGGKVFTSAYLHRPQSCVLKRLPPRFCCKKVASAPRPPVQHLLADPKRRTTNMLSERQIEALAWTLHKVGEECSDLQIPDTCGIGDFVTNSGSGTFGHFLGKWKDTIVGDLRNMIDPSYQLDRKVKSIVDDGAWSIASRAIDGLQKPTYWGYIKRYSMQLLDIFQQARNKHPDFAFALCTLVPLYVSFCVRRGPVGSSNLASLDCERLEEELNIAAAASKKGSAPAGASVASCDGGFVPCTAQFCCESGFPLAAVELNVKQGDRDKVSRLLSPLQCSIPPASADLSLRVTGHEKDSEVFLPTTQEEADEAVERLKAALKESKGPREGSRSRIRLGTKPQKLGKPSLVGRHSTLGVSSPSPLVDEEKEEEELQGVFKAVRETVKTSGENP